MGGHAAPSFTMQRTRRSIPILFHRNLNTEGLYKYTPAGICCVCEIGRFRIRILALPARSVPMQMKQRIHIHAAPGWFWLLMLAAASLHAQGPDAAPGGAADDPPERWDISWQATSIGQAHDNFQSPYQGPE